MDRQYYIDLAENGLCMPIGADLILHQHADYADILSDGKRLGEVLEETARHFCTPLAVPHMDLELEKKVLLEMIGIETAEIAKFHFSDTPDAETIDKVKTGLAKPMSAEMQAQIDAVRYIAQNTELLPIGMTIGPFSLMTKLVADPITPVCMAGMGMTAEDDPEIGLVQSVLELGMLVILHNVKQQIDAGAKAIFIAEPAANKVYLSPNQIAEGSDIFERYVIRYNRRIKTLLDEHGVDLIFHCCGELTPYMVSRFAGLDPAILSLGSSRKLWEDAELVEKTTVLYGNLPSKQFYSDELISLEDVVERGAELINKMRIAEHPFILGTECDVLSVAGSHERILQKAEAVSNCTCKSVDLGNLKQYEQESSIH